MEVFLKLEVALSKNEILYIKKTNFQSKKIQSSLH